MSLLSADLFSVLDPGQLLLGRFRIVQLAGRGGMGEVYEAEDLQLRERVAVKTIRAQVGGDDRMLDRFRREIALSRQVTHPNVCRMFEMHEATVSGRPLVFLTMEYLDGETLAEFLKREAPLTRQRAFPIIEQMTAALGAAHAAGVIHRDFKSSNVFLSKDRAGELRVVVTDFGLARTPILTARHCRKPFSQLAPLDGDWKLSTGDDSPLRRAGLRPLLLAHGPRARRGDPPPPR